MAKQLYENFKGINTVIEKKKKNYYQLEHF
jgi:hypothetical protein